MSSESIILNLSSVLGLLYCAQIRAAHLPGADNYEVPLHQRKEG